MFELKRNGSTVTIKVSYHIPFGSDWTSGFEHNCSSENEAQLLYGVLTQVFDDKIIKVRREEYNNGWKDKSSKNTKNTWFSCKL